MPVLDIPLAPLTSGQAFDSEALDLMWDAFDEDLSDGLEHLEPMPDAEQLPFCPMKVKLSA